MEKNFKKVGENLFASDFALEEAIKHGNQFLSKLDSEINFVDLWQEKLLETYKGGAELGAPPYNPIIVFKMLFLSYLFDNSEREIERVVNDSISMKQFLGLGLMDPAPDHSTLTKFKNRILNYNLLNDRDLLKEVFDEIIILAQERGVDLGHTLAIDSTHTIANVNTDKEKKRTKKLTDNGDGKPPRDSDAKWGVKKSETRKTTEGKKVKVNHFYCGYKSHTEVFDSYWHRPNKPGRVCF
jgi:transposase